MKPATEPTRILRTFFWGTTIRCNLAYVHRRRLESNETGSADLSAWQAQALIEHAIGRGVRTVISTNGVGIRCVDYNGNVHPDQFWWHYDPGSIHQRPISEIWTDSGEPLLQGLRDCRSRIKGRCRLCRDFDACGGSLRGRADAIFHDPWTPDPACYLTDEEIGLTGSQRRQLIDAGESFDLSSLVEGSEHG